MKPLLRWSLWTLLGLLLAGLGLGAGLWGWSGSDTSLAVALRQAQRVLPAGQTLEAREVSGSLRSGGRIGWLRWESGGLSVEAFDVTAAWLPAALLQRQLRLSQLAIQRLVIHDQRAPSPASASEPPTDVGLPFRVDAAVQVNALEWLGVSTQRLDQLSVHYVFDSYLHRLEKGQGLFLSNIYRFSGELQASGPLALKLQVEGGLDAPVPGSTEPLHLNALATVTGALAGPQAELVLQADLKPQGTPAPAPAAGSKTAPAAMQASLSAHIAPWQAQRILSAEGRWQALNLATIWSQAPQTALTGQASVSPQGPGWQARLALDNTLSGPWDQQRLPLQQLQAGLTYTDGHWLLQHLQAQAAGGSVQGRGQTSAGTAGLWQGEVQVQGINPAAIDTRLAADDISGTLSARQSLASDPTTAQGNAANPVPVTPFSFDIALQSTRQRAAQRVTAKPVSAQADLLAGLRLGSLQAQGVWSAPQLDLSSLTLEVAQAQLRGQLKVNTASLATQGKLSLQLPGLQAQADGRLSPADGLGNLSVQLQNASQANQWFQQWPGLVSQLANLQASGSAALTARWQGGWQQNAQALRLDASLQVPQLAVATRPVPPAASVQMRVQDAQLALSGLMRELTISSQGQIGWDTQQVTWQTQASAGRGPDGDWQASIRQLQLSLRPPGSPNPWRLQIGTAEDGAPGPLAQPVTLRWQPGSDASTLAVSAGSARLRGPRAGTVGISWQPTQWVPASNPGKPAQWRSQGRVEGVPLAWLDAFTEQTLAELGVTSDLLLAGSWDAASSDMLHFRATLERSAGDVRLQAEAGRSAALPAGLQEAWLQVNLDGDQVASTLRWDSARAGKALAAFSTQLRHDSSGWAWPDSAPLGGSLQLQLPPVDAWSALAPPGWRLRGTVDSHINLAGTRAQPQWEGTLRARDLAVRSLVDGIDFSQGTLDARLHGQQLDIQTFTLRGAGTPQNTAAGGQLSVTGSVRWLAHPGQASPVHQVQMALQAQLSALRLSARPDRRLSASGQLEAELKDARLTLRGNLSADQALFTLPDDNTPKLDDDVRVRPTATASDQTGAPAPTGTRAGRTISTDVSVNLDLGPDFQVRGRGLQTRLAGKLVLTAQGGAAPELTGSIRAVNGTYQAYGQRLQITRSFVRFYGPIDNPALAILAIRPKLTQRVGVQISGTALSPVVALYSDPSLPDVETLSWLVLGRSGGAGGAEAALMQQAALALLGGGSKTLADNLSSALGLDELSFRSGGDGSDNGGTASGASVTLGKRLSQDFYVAYESSLGSAVGVFYIFYDISRRLTLRAQTGEQSAVDLIYTLRYD